MRLARARVVRRLGMFAMCAHALLACDHGTTANRPTEPKGPDIPVTSGDSLRLLLRAGLTAVRIVGPPPVRPQLVQLGQALAFDAVLSGPKNISCMTCHQPAFATGDGRSLAVGQGGRGVGPSRTRFEGQAFTPRNSPALFNLVGRKAPFRDGRVELRPDGKLYTPAGAKLTPEMTRVFEFGALSAAPLFPVLDRLEMRGTAGTELASIPDDDMAGVWSALMKRLGQIPEYRALFEAAYPGTPFDAMTFAHASNAIAGFFTERFSLVNSPFQKFVAGDDYAMTPAQVAGGREFVKSNCLFCHLVPSLRMEAFIIPRFRRSDRACFHPTNRPMTLVVLTSRPSRPISIASERRRSSMSN